MSVKLFEKSEPAKVIKTFDGPGRGRKQCSSCEEYVGVRTKVCICGHSFVRKKDKEKKKKEEQKKVKAKDYIDFQSIPSSTRERICITFAPAGKSPVELKSTGYEEVMEWVQAVRSVGYTRGEYYTVSALKCYAKYFYDTFSDDFLIVEGHLETLKKLPNEMDYNYLYQRRLAKRMGEVFEAIALGYQKSKQVDASTRT